MAEVARPESEINSSLGVVGGFSNDRSLMSMQEEFFQVAGKTLTENVLTGYNGTIFAYGMLLMN